MGGTNAKILQPEIANKMMSIVPRDTTREKSKCVAKKACKQGDIPWDSYCIYYIHSYRKTRCRINNNDRIKFNAYIYI